MIDIQLCFILIFVFLQSLLADCLLLVCMGTIGTTYSIHDSQNNYKSIL